MNSGGVGQLPPPFLQDPTKGKGQTRGLAWGGGDANEPGAGPHLHGWRAATNPDRRSGSPRAFWGRTDSPKALWKAGPAAGGGGTTPGAAPGIRAGSRALPVSGGGVRRAGGLLGGLRRERRARARQRDSRRATAATGTGAMTAGMGRAAAAPRVPSRAVLPLPAPERGPPSAGAARRGERGPGQPRGDARGRPAPVRGPPAAPRPRARPSRGEAGCARASSRLLFPARQVPLRPRAAAPGSPEARRVVAAAAPRRRRDPRGGRAASRRSRPAQSETSPSGTRAGSGLEPGEPSADAGALARRSPGGPGGRE